MPVFEYICSKCLHEFEVFVDGKEPKKCPKCGAKISKLVSMVGRPIIH